MTPLEGDAVDLIGMANLSIFAGATPFEQVSAGSIGIIYLLILTGMTQSDGGAADIIGAGNLLVFSGKRQWMEPLRNLPARLIR